MYRKNTVVVGVRSAGFPRGFRGRGARVPGKVSFIIRNSSFVITQSFHVTERRKVRPGRKERVICLI